MKNIYNESIDGTQYNPFSNTSGNVHIDNNLDCSINNNNLASKKKQHELMTQTHKQLQLQQVSNNQSSDINTNSNNITSKQNNIRKGHDRKKENENMNYAPCLSNQHQQKQLSSLHYQANNNIYTTDPHNQKQQKLHPKRRVKSNTNHNSGGKGNDSNGKDNGNEDSSHMIEILSNESIDGLNHNMFNNISSTVNMKNQKQQKLHPKRRVKSNNNYNSGGKDNDINGKDNGNEASSLMIDILSNESIDGTNHNMFNNISSNVNINNNFDSGINNINLKSLKQHKLLLQNQ